MIGAAKGGTLFLDEIGELSLDLQPKLLRFLESGEICPIGEAKPFTINVRIVAATNADVEQQVKDGLRFREDLVPPAERGPPAHPAAARSARRNSAMVRHFFVQAAGEFRKADVRVADDTMEHLLLYRWPGNVRQLQNEIRRMVALAEPGAVADTALTCPTRCSRMHGSPRGRRRTPTSWWSASEAKLQPTLSSIEREMIFASALLQDHRDKQFRCYCPRALGLSRKGLYLKRQRLGL